MTRLGGVLALVVCLAAAACSKKADRQAMCDTAKSTFVDGLNQQADTFDKQGNGDAAKAIRDALAHAEPRFMDFCKGLDDNDIDCLSKGGSALSEPACQHTIESMKSQLLGM